MGRSTVCTIIKETCEAVSRVLAKDFVKAPSCALDWEGISREFEKRWNFPNCVGMYVPYAVAVLYHTIFISRSKHIVVQAPINSGSLYYNYKGQHSVVLLAVCDAHYRYVSCCFLLPCTQYLCINGHCLYHYRFTLIDLGDVGRHSDGGALAHSNFGQALEDNSLSFLAPCPLPGTIRHCW